MKRHIAFFIFLFSYSIATAQEVDLTDEFLQLEEYLTVMDSLNESVSQAPVKWHLLHLLQVINGTMATATHSDPDGFESKSSFEWFYVSTTGKIPRGVGKAPDAVNPSFDISEDDIRIELEAAKLSLMQWSDLDDDNYFRHPVFLDLNKRKLKKFLKIHTRHHLHIVEDIVEL
ncbi:DUF1569 domain-containing protein [Cryomorphaceae bacterium 1068]|nr:DUF1569 domain-containing protein [Cryomorphaceae bacterium 1068]